MSPASRALLTARDEHIRRLEAELMTARHAQARAEAMNRRTETDVRASVLSELLFDVNEAVSGAEEVLTFLTEMRTKIENLK